MAATDDKELLENAARAVGVDLVWNATSWGGKPKPGYWSEAGFVHWNPLETHGVAHELARILGIQIHADEDSGTVSAWIRGGPAAEATALGDPDRTARLFVEVAAKRGLELKAIEESEAIERHATPGDQRPGGRGRPGAGGL